MNIAINGETINLESLTNCGQYLTDRTDAEQLLAHWKSEAETKRAYTITGSDTMSDYTLAWVDDEHHVHIEAWEAWPDYELAVFLEIATRSGSRYTLRDQA